VRTLGNPWKELESSKKLYDALSTSHGFWPFSDGVKISDSPGTELEMLEKCLAEQFDQLKAVRAVFVEVCLFLAFHKMAKDSSGSTQIITDQVADVNAGRDGVQESDIEPHFWSHAQTYLQPLPIEPAGAEGDLE
jgi:HJR/Mrr/RecB family endonuclease